MNDLSVAERSVIEERRRQISAEGWSLEHDDTHTDGEIARSAAAYAFVGSLSDWWRSNLFPSSFGGLIRDLWPDTWDRSWFKPKSRREDLVRAGALIIAEIERIDRLSGVAGPTAASSYQDRVAAWVSEVSKDDPFDLAEHRDRFVEEALELAQSLDQTAADAHALVDYVFGRPIGEPHQEMGGTMVTLAKLATAAGLDMAGSGDSELTRCWRPEVLEKIRRKRLTRHGRGPLPGISQPATAAQTSASQSSGQEA